MSHRDIQEHDVHPTRAPFDSVSTGTRFARYRKFIVFGQQGFQSRAHNLVVVRNQDASHKQNLLTRSRVIDRRMVSSN